MRDIVFERNLANTAMQVVRIWHLHFRISFDITDVTSTEFIGFCLALSFIYFIFGLLSIQIFISESVAIMLKSTSAFLWNL